MLHLKRLTFKYWCWLSGKEKRVLYHLHKDIIDNIYKILNIPLQGLCTAGKFFGGNWYGEHGCMDGHKYVCLDKLYVDVKNKNCLIYSFGIANDWTFEAAMADLGCTVHAFDPTVDGENKPETDLVRKNLFPGNSKRSGRLCTVNLLFKVACFVTKEKKYFRINHMRIWQGKKCVAI